MFNTILINKNFLINNIKQVRANNPNSFVCAMVKANAYGVGIKQVVSAIDNFVDYYGVACFFEAKILKDITEKQILIVGALEDKIDLRFIYSCSSLAEIKALKEKNLAIKIHLKVNSGMNRYGFKDLKEFEKAIKLIKNSKLVLDGIFTHFATADYYTDEQMKNFNKFVNLSHKYGFNPIIHADNSLVNQTNNHNLDMVRVGYSLYLENKNGFNPVVEIKSKIEQINHISKGELVGYNYKYVAKSSMKVAIVPVGYADGFSTRLIGFNLKVKNRNCKILNVCMDCFMLDISGIKMKKGDEIYILDKFNSLCRYAKYLSISDYEVSTNFSNIRADRKLILSSHSKHKQNEP